jgi:acetyl-CoA C-acetyltransferase
MKVFVMGIGLCGTFPASGGQSYRELIARAASQAYLDAGITADQLDGAVSVEEDFVSGYSISDEYVPDQLGVVKKSVYTICGDFLHGLGSAIMQLRTGQFKMVVLEGYSKASNILTKDEMLSFAYDPTFNRLGVSPHYLAGIEMQQLLADGKYTKEDVANVVVQMRKNALANSNATYGTNLTTGDVLGARPVAEPLTENMIARHADASVAIVLGTEEVVKSAKAPVCVSGVGWTSGNSIIERRPHNISEGTKAAATMAFNEAKISHAKDCDALYVSDLYAHRALMHMDALGLEKDQLERINPDGGVLGMGDLFEANGGARIYDAVQQLRGHAGTRQINNAKKAMVHGWRGLPTDSCAVAVLEA